jgi:hypothetical protein
LVLLVLLVLRDVPSSNERTVSMAGERQRDPALWILTFAYLSSRFFRGYLETACGGRAAAADCRKTATGVVRVTIFLFSTFVSIPANSPEQGMPFG